MKRILFCLFSVFCGQNIIYASYHWSIVQCPVVDLRAEPVAMSLSMLNAQHERTSNYYKDAPSIFNADNPLQVSQLLFGEHVLIERYDDQWVRVLAVEQPMYGDDGVWKPCAGFARASAFYQFDDFQPDYTKHSLLAVTVPWATVYGYRGVGGAVETEARLVDVSFGSTLTGLRRCGDWWFITTTRGNAVIAAKNVCIIKKDPLPINELLLRQRVVIFARLFVDSPYIWAGCSAWVGYNEHPVFEPADCITGFDCSGLTYLAHKALGLLIPRNSWNQYLASEHIDHGCSLAMGDLIFLAKPVATSDGLPKFKIGHVIFYCGKDLDGDDLLLESQGIFYSKNAADEYVVAPPQLIDPPFGCREIRAKDHLLFKYYKLADLASGQMLTARADDLTIERRVFFGTFFTPEKIAQGRNSFFGAKAITRVEELTAH